MASWTVLLAFSEFHCDMGKGELSFSPRQEGFTTFWSTGRAWGAIIKKKMQMGNGSHRFMF